MIKLSGNACQRATSRAFTFACRQLAKGLKTTHGDTSPARLQEDRREHLCSLLDTYLPRNAEKQMEEVVRGEKNIGKRTQRMVVDLLLQKKNSETEERRRKVTTILRGLLLICSFPFPILLFGVLVSSRRVVCRYPIISWPNPHDPFVGDHVKTMDWQRRTSPAVYVPVFGPFPLALWRLRM